MTEADAAQVGWDVLLPVLKFTFCVAIYLLGLALLKEITR